MVYNVEVISPITILCLTQQNTEIPICEKDLKNLMLRIKEPGSNFKHKLPDGGHNNV